MITAISPGSTRRRSMRGYIRRSDVRPLDRHIVMYYHYIMISASLLWTQEPSIRTQISLTRAIKRAVEAKGRLLGESLSEYLRKAAVIRLLSEDEEAEELKRLANTFVGAGKWKKTHPHWRNKAAVKKWQRTIREEWE